MMKNLKIKLTLNLVQLKTSHIPMNYGDEPFVILENLLKKHQVSVPSELFVKLTFSGPVQIDLLPLLLNVRAQIIVIAQIKVLVKFVTPKIFLICALSVNLLLCQLLLVKLLRLDGKLVILFYFIDLRV